jgi:hypothetical protein
MSNQLSIHPGLSAVGPGENIALSRGNTPLPPPVQAPVPKVAPKPVQLFVNPSYRFDPTVGIEVIQFHDSTGTVTNTIPSQRQLAAYRSHQATPPGEQSSEPPQMPPPANAKVAAG